MRTEEKEKESEISTFSRTLEQSEGEQDICNLSAEVGPCKAFAKRFYFDPQDGRCKGFVYGGCGGNRNNFHRVRDCEIRCGVHKGEHNIHSKEKMGGRGRIGTQSLTTSKPE